jgi:hypothetical protein
MDAVQSPEVATLSESEVEAAIAHLTDGEKTAVMKIARLYARKTPYDHHDLVQEALVRTLSGRRAWPRNAKTTLFLGGVIRSIAWEWKNEPPPSVLMPLCAMAPMQRPMSRRSVSCHPHLWRSHRRL